MRVRWTTDAANDLERICDYIAGSRTESARRVAKTIVEGVGTLELLPESKIRPCVRCSIVGRARSIGVESNDQAGHVRRAISTLSSLPRICTAGKVDS